MELLTVGALKTGFRKDGTAKTMSSQESFFGDCRVDFVGFLEALGLLFLTFAALETGLKIECLSRSSWGS